MFLFYLEEVVLKIFIFNFESIDKKLKPVHFKN